MSPDKDYAEGMQRGEGAMVRRLLAIVSAFALVACVEASALVRDPGQPESRVWDRSQAPELMNRLVGHWVLTGVIAGEHVTHDVDAAWALQGNYVRIEEISRERGDNARPKYEATIFLGWLAASDRYVCIWLDNTEVSSGNVTCTGAQAQGAIPLEFRDEHGTLMIATTFAYDRAEDTWAWQINNVDNGRVTPFASLSLRRR